jgi:RNA polymerase sigma-70 factor (ECF subfamily)
MRKGIPGTIRLTPDWQVPFMFTAYDPQNDSATPVSPALGNRHATGESAAQSAGAPQEVGVWPSTSRTELSDKDLMGLVTTQHDWALHMLYDRYFRRAFALAYRMLTDAEAAEDCVQDVFLKVWNQPQLYDPERGAFASWLLTVVHHRAANHLRARKQLVPLPTPAFDTGEETGESNLVDPAPPVEEQVWLSEQQQIVRAALAVLTPVQREALELSYFGGMTQSEIATHLGQPLGTIKTRVRSGLLRLRDALEGKLT